MYFRESLGLGQAAAAMEISGGQGANGAHLYGLAPNFLEMGATVAPIF